MSFLSLSSALVLVAAVGVADSSPSTWSQQPTYLKKLMSRENAPSEKKEARTLEELVLASDHVRNAFEQGDPGELESCLGPQKVFVLLGSEDEPGFYGGDQLRFMLERLFRERETRAFRSSTHDIEIADDDNATMRADWTYIVLDSDDEVTERLRFQFEKKNESWWLSEIKSSRH